MGPDLVQAVFSKLHSLLTWCSRKLRSSFIRNFVSCFSPPFFAFMYRVSATRLLFLSLGSRVRYSCFEETSMLNVGVRTRAKLGLRGKSDYLQFRVSPPVLSVPCERAVCVYASIIPGSGG